MRGKSTSEMLSALRGHLMLLGAAVLWGCNAPMIKDLQGLGVPALVVADMRAVGAAVAFWVMSLFVGGGERVSVSMLGRLCVAGILCIVLNQVLFTVGVNYTSPIDATVISTMLPIVTMIFAAIILKESITGMKVVGIAVGAAGALTLVFGGGGSSAGGGLVGDALCFTAQVSCALYMVIFSNTIHRYSVVTLMKWLFLFSAIIVTMVTWPSVVAVDYASLPLKAWGEMLFIVFGGTFVSYIFFTDGQKLLRPTVVSMYNYVQPIVATVLSVAMGVGTFGVGKVTSMAMVFAGVYIVTHAKNSTAKG
ncbi:MAG TPA: DMT family transporter [Candidatus Alistipes merdipullorum]|nr:DMT family transporter [Candidatus Alistipes merdipullorum]